MNCDILKLDNQLCFPIYVASREIIQTYNQHFEALEITYPQYLVLLVLWENGEMSVNSIGKKLFLDSGTLTPLLKRMESKNLITRTRSKEDERTVIISLTEKGTQLKEKALEIPSKIKNELPLNEDELQTLKQLMYKLINCER